MTSEPANNVAPAAQAGGADNTLRSMSTKQVKKLYNRARSIRTLSFFWLLAIAMCIVFISTAAPGSPRFITSIVFAVLAAAAVFGTWRFEPWGRYISIALCIAILPFFIWGTVFGVLGLLALIGSKPLFGRARITQAQLREEMSYRKANNVA